MAEEAEKKRLAEEAEKKRLFAEEAEKKRLLAEEAEKKRLLAEEAEKKRLAEEAEKKRLAEEAEQKRILAEEADEVESESEAVDGDVNATWKDVDSDEMSVEKLATRAQINGYLKQISNGLNSIIYTTSLKPKNIESYIANITAAYKELINPPSLDVIKNIRLEGDDGILTKITDLLDVLNKNIDGKYSNDQIRQIYRQSNIILTDIDKILGPYDDIREERKRLLATKRGDNTLEDIERYTNDVGNALRIKQSDVNPPIFVAPPSTPADMPPPPSNTVVKQREKLFPSRTKADFPPPPANVVVKQREQLFPSSTQAVKPPLPPAKSDINATVQAQPYRSHANTSHFMEDTVESRNWAKEGREAAKIAAKHQEQTKHNRQVYKPTIHIGGKSTKKKSRKSSHNKRHTKRAMPRKQQTKTRNKRTKRGRNQTHKK